MSSIFLFGMIFKHFFKTVVSAQAENKHQKEIVYHTMVQDFHQGINEFFFIQKLNF